MHLTKTMLNWFSKIVCICFSEEKNLCWKCNVMW